MADDNERRWLPWSREADAKAKLYGSIAGVFLAILGSSSGVLRVDKFGLSDHLRSAKYEREVTNGQIAAAISKRRTECAVIRGSIEKRMDLVDMADANTAGGLKACRDNYTQLHHDVRELRKRINGMGR